MLVFLIFFYLTATFFLTHTVQHEMRRSCQHFILLITTERVKNATKIGHWRPWLVMIRHATKSQDTNIRDNDRYCYAENHRWPQQFLLSHHLIKMVVYDEH